MAGAPESPRPVRQQKRKRRPEAGGAVTASDWDDPDGWLGFGALLHDAGLDASLVRSSPAPQPQKKSKKRATEAPLSSEPPGVTSITTRSPVPDFPQAMRVWGADVVHGYLRPQTYTTNSLTQALATTFRALFHLRGSVLLGLEPSLLTAMRERLGALMAVVEALGRDHSDTRAELTDTVSTFAAIYVGYSSRKAKAAAGVVRCVLALDAAYYDLFCYARKTIPKPDFQALSAVIAPTSSTAHHDIVLPEVPAPHEYYAALESLLYCHTDISERMANFLAALRSSPLADSQPSSSSSPLPELWGIASDNRPSTCPPWTPGADPLRRVYQARVSEGLWLLPGCPAATVGRWHQCLRDWAARVYAFAIPTPDALRAIGSPVVEVGPGLGYWAAQLRAVGADVLPLDIAPAAAHERWLPTRRGSAADLAGSRCAAYPTLLLCFPSPPDRDGSSMADAALAAFRGRRVCYVGEWATGMTGSLAFHQRLLRNFVLIQKVALPNWSQMCAELFVFERLSAPPPAPPPLWRCDACSGAKATLRRCPVVRHFIVCSEACYTAAAARHVAVLRAGHWGPQRPPLAEFHRVKFVDCHQHPSEYAALQQIVPNEQRH